MPKKKQPEKLIINNELIHDIELEYDLEKLIDNFKSYLESEDPKYKQYDRLYLEKFSDGDYYTSWTIYNLMGSRLETDEEYNNRIEGEKLRNIEREEWELKQYKELQKKYGGI